MIVFRDKQYSCVGIFSSENFMGKVTLNFIFHFNENNIVISSRKRIVGIGDTQRGWKEKSNL